MVRAHTRFDASWSVCRRAHCSLKWSCADQTVWSGADPRRPITQRRGIRCKACRRTHPPKGRSTRRRGSAWTSLAAVRRWRAWGCEAPTGDPAQAQRLRAIQLCHDLRPRPMSHPATLRISSASGDQGSEPRPVSAARAEIQAM
jgi:hypothetical protein